MKTIITYGTFDLFHAGHVRLLERLSKLGERLIVAVSTDDFNELKGKRSFYSFEERKVIVQNSKYVDLVIEERSWDQKESDIITYNVDIFAMGDDWKGKFDFLTKYCEVIYVERTPVISTTKIKSDLSNITEHDLSKLESTMHDALRIIKDIKSISFKK